MIRFSIVTPANRPVPPLLLPPMPNPFFDLVIVGAGPAGCAAALALRANNAKVILVDKKAFPRDKVCGDAIPGHAIKTLHQLLENTGETLLHFTEKQSIQTSDLYTAKGKKLSVEWTLKTFNSRRIDFDNYLLSLVQKHTSTSIDQNFFLKEIKQNNGWELTADDGRKINAKLVIGCDGAHSFLRRNLLPKETARIPQGVALRRYYKDVDIADTRNDFFLFNEGCTGYFWIFPVGNNVYNTGIGISAIDSGKLDLKALFDKMIVEHPLIASRLKNATPLEDTIGYRLPFGGNDVPISGDGFMLTGDAAYLIDPLQGHGIHTAIKSGQLAAAQAIKCLEENNFSGEGMKAYDQAVYKAFGKDFKRNASLLRYLYHKPKLVELAAIFTKNKMVQNALKKFF